MANLPNGTIDQQPTAPQLEATGFFIYRSVDRGRTERVPTEQVVPSVTSGNFEWLTDTTYNINDVVTYASQWWQAQQAVPENIIPGTDVAYWVAIPRSASGFVFWSAGVYTDDEVLVLRAIDNLVQLFRLVDAARPYVSASLEQEFVDGDWDLMSEGAYMGITKTSHGWAVNDVITWKSGDWNDWAVGDGRLAMVRQVVDANRAIVVLITGRRLRNLSGLTPGAEYYLQNDGTISTTPANDAIFLAISTTEAILYT